jgi:predicted N-acetyltransferase YhbS
MSNALADAPTNTRQTAPTHIPLGDGLRLRSVQSQADAERYAVFNRDYVSAIQGLTCEKLLAYHPTMRWDDFFFVEDERSGAIVSCICLIPWQVSFGFVDMRVAMLEMVVTHPDYRHRGLVRKQVEHFQRCAAQQGFDLCIIEGIPYYYRQYGYVYATDHWASDGLALARVPEGDGGASIDLRAATMADVEALDRFYTQAMSQLTGWTMRNHDYWRYLIEAADFPVTMVTEATSGEALGYVVAWRNGSGVQIAESGLPNAATALAVLQWCKSHIGGEAILGWPTLSTLVQVGRSLGSSIRPADQWLIRLLDLPNFLLKIAPLLAARLAASPYAGLNAELTLNLFRQAYLLRFVAGELIRVEPLGFVDASMGTDGGDLCIPPDAFTRLLLGYRTLDELADAWPDMVVRPACRHLWQVLWPKQPVYFWLPYMAYSAKTRILTNDFSQPA